MANNVSSTLATRIIFFIAGFITATWAVIVPFARGNTGVNEAQLGTLLLCLGVGALIAMPVTGWLTSRFGCRRVILVAVTLVIISTPWLSVLSNPLLLALALLVFGVGIGVTDCAMNIQAILVEKQAAKPVMSSFHGMYSVGGIAGAGFMTLLLAMGFSVLTGCLLAVAAVIIMTLVSAPGLLTYANPAEGPVFAVPRGSVLIIGIICFAVFLTEGTVLDWSAVYLTDVRAIPASLGGLGYTCFAIAMTVARLTGDRIISSLGRLPVVLGGALVAAAGMAMVTFIDSWPLALLGYTLVGAGCANIVPVMFSAAGRQTVMPQAVAVPAITTLGYMGVLSGPAVIGYVAHYTHLAFSFSLIMALMLIVGAVSLTLDLGRSRAGENA
ncbi:MFS transporter [Pantoea agglomerans]|uniref:MFS transporter n=1 Tax=Enterobacter agglomerans TaxID=549 RepID=UPI0010C09A0F|nr:MFS transporter [Pantoea agglomerans]MBD8222841.1 MFS transporter [Pantoea agglomerans]TKJ55839.1 MFS transporter [Pantoea agglomerans]TKK18090.1 MFS transporter [Pantoea agglomerans]TKK38023.1 MFS transporter [Pantoea agglomerans]